MSARLPTWHETLCHCVCDTHSQERQYRRRQADLPHDQLEVTFAVCQTGPPTART